jgi:hypothetical protein
MYIQRSRLERYDENNSKTKMQRPGIEPETLRYLSIYALGISSTLYVE